MTSIGTEAAAERHRRIDDELALGRRLQRSFLTLDAPEAPGYDLASHYEQAHEVGGDFFDLFRLLRRGRPLSVVVADVTGKGVAAALLMAFARPVIHAAIDHASGPADALERTNRVLRERRASLFITALCGSLTLSTGRLRLANAGHEPPLLVRGDGSPIAPIEGGGPLLGAFPSLDIAETSTQLASGDIVVLYTDGVTDAGRSAASASRRPACTRPSRRLEVDPPSTSWSRSGARSTRFRRVRWPPTTSRWSRSVVVEPDVAPCLDPRSSP